MNPLRLVFVEPKGGGKIQDGVTVTPTKQEQTVEPDPGFDGLGAVKVEAIPDAFQDVTGVNAGAEDIRVGKVGIDAQGNLLNGEMLPRKTEQEKSVVPTKQAQTVSPDSGHALSAVNVAKIPDAYQDVSFVDNEAADIRVGKTGVSSTGERLDGQMLPRKPEQSKTVTPTKSSQLVEPDAGYALSSVEVDAIPDEYANVSGVTADADKVKSGYVFVDSEGVETRGTNTDDADTSDGTMSASQLEAGAVGYSQGQRIVGTKPIRSADVEIDSLSPVPIPAGSYDGTVKARLADPTEIDPAVIAQGHSILGVSGTLSAQDNLPAFLNNTLTSISDSTLTSLSHYAIYYKSSLTSVSFPNVTTIGNAAVAYNSNLQTINFPLLERFSLGGNNGECFRNCGLTGAVELPNLKTNDGRGHFRECRRMTSFSAPLLTIVCSYMFENCSDLSLLNLPSAETVQLAIINGSGIRELSLPSLVSASGGDGNESFKSSRLETLDLGENVTTLNYALGNAPNLTTVIIRATAIPTLSGALFGNTPFKNGGTGGTIYIPETLYNHLGDGTALDYKAATNWSVIDAYGTITWAKIEGSQYEVTST